VKKSREPGKMEEIQEKFFNPQVPGNNYENVEF